MDENYQISVIIPNRNEPNVKELCSKIKQVLNKDARIYKFEVIVENDPEGLGYGVTLKKGISKSRFSWILIMDADHSYSPWDIPKLINEIQYADMVVSERRGTIVTSGIIRSIGRLIVKHYARFRTGFPIIDINSGMRIFKRSILNNFMDKLSDRFSFTTTLTLLCFFRNYRVRYVPCFYQHRVGSSTLSPINFFRFIFTVEKCLKHKFKTT